MIIAAFQSGDTSWIKESLRHVRQEGNYHILPALIELMMHTQDEQIENECMLILCDIKDPHAPELLAGAITDYRNHPRLKSLVSACWQSMQDFSPYLELFISMAMDDSYELALEAFSVIEESIENLDSVSREGMAERIREGLATADTDKRKLLIELISVISPFSGPFRPAPQD
jgi:hypothetical protein